MSLQFIFGNSGAGKSYTLFRSVIEDSIRHPEQSYLVIVPEQFTMQTQKDIVTRHPNHGTMNIDIVSFARLAYRIFEELSWRQVAMKMGRRATEESVRKEYNRFFEEN